MWRLAADAFSFAGALDQTLAQRINRNEIGAHSFNHDLLVDVDHVAMTNVIFIYHRGHLDAGTKFTGQSSRRKD